MRPLISALPPRVRCAPVLLALAFLLAPAGPSAAISGQSRARERALSELPVVEIRAPEGPMLALFWSGDGGWAELPDRIGHELARLGVAVVGVNSHRWLGRAPRTPAEAAHDSERLLRYYLARWDRSRVLLVGFSRGAEFVPFIVNRLPVDLRQRISLAGMLGAERTASFEFHLSDLVTSTARPTDLPAKAEIERTTGVHYFCLYGTQEANSVCRDLDPGKVTVLARTGDHHFDGDYEGIANDLLRAAGASPAGAPGTPPR